MGFKLRYRTTTEEDDPVFAAAATTMTEQPAREDMQTFIFSATLSKDLQNNLKRQKRTSRKGPKTASALGELRHSDRVL